MRVSDLYKLNTKSGSPLRSSINDTPFFCRLRPTTLPLLDPWRCFYEASGHFGPLELAEGQQSPDSRRRKLLLVQEVESVTYRTTIFQPHRAWKDRGQTFPMEGGRLSGPLQEPNNRRNLAPAGNGTVRARRRRCRTLGW